MPLMFQIVVAVLVVAVLLWAGDRLLALWPGQEKLKQVVKIIVIVVVALWCLSLVAELLSVGMPWNMNALPRHRR